MSSKFSDSVFELVFFVIVMVLFIAPAVTTSAIAGTIDVCTYSCPICNKISEFKEDSAHIHKCSGDDKKKHNEIVMTFKGHTKKEVK